MYIYHSYKNISICFYFESNWTQKYIITTYMDTSVIIIMTFDESHAHSALNDSTRFQSESGGLIMEI